MRTQLVGKSLVCAAAALTLFTGPAGEAAQAPERRSPRQEKAFALFGLLSPHTETIHPAIAHQLHEMASLRHVRLHRNRIVGSNFVLPEEKTCDAVLGLMTKFGLSVGQKEAQRLGESHRGAQEKVDEAMQQPPPKGETVREVETLAKGRFAIRTRTVDQFWEKVIDPNKPERWTSAHEFTAGRRPQSWLRSLGVQTGDHIRIERVYRPQKPPTMVVKRIVARGSGKTPSEETLLQAPSPTP